MPMFKAESEFDGFIRRAAEASGVEVAVIKAVIAQESRFDPRARKEEPQIGDRSRGLMQLLERTARGLRYGGSFGPQMPGNWGGDFELDGLYDPETSIHLGAKLLADNLRRAVGKTPDDRLNVALSAYNGGFSTVRPGDAKRNADGSFINAGYVAAVRKYLEYFRRPPAPSSAPSRTSSSPKPAAGGGKITPSVFLIAVLAAVLVTAALPLLRRATS